jgi:hypothetical protein
MLGYLGYDSMESFIGETVPADIRIKEVSDEDVKPFSELELMRRAERLAEMNRPMKSYIGMGYHNSIVPPVIQRNVSSACDLGIRIRVRKVIGKVADEKMRLRRGGNRDPNRRSVPDQHSTRRRTSEGRTIVSARSSRNAF